MSIRTGIALVVGLAGIGVWRGTHPSGEIATDVVFGWIGYLSRVLPEVTIRWDGIAIFVGGLAMSAIVAHFLLNGFFRELKALIPINQLRWRFRWTIVLLGSVILMFTAGISMVGITHQVTWLLTAKEPIFGRNLKYKWTSQKSNLRDLGLAVLNFSDVDGFPTREVTTRNGESHSWVLPVLPYLSGGYVASEVDTARPWNDPVNARHFKSLIPQLLNPAFRGAPLRDRTGFGLNHYAGNSELFDRHTEIPDDKVWIGQSNLLLIGEVNSDFVAWGRPDNSRHASIGINAPGGFGGPAGSDGAQFVMADGSVRLINKKIDPHVLKSLSRPAP